MKKIYKLALSCMGVFLAFGVASCSGEGEHESIDRTMYNVECEKCDYYEYSGIKSSTKGVDVNFTLKSLFPACEIAGATYNGVDCTKLSEEGKSKTFGFTMPASNVEVKASFNWSELLASGTNDFLSFDSENVYTAQSALGDESYNNNEYWGTPLILNWKANAGIMTIATIECFSVDEDILPSSAIASSSKTAESSNNIIGGTLVIDRSKAKVGKTKVVLRVKSGNNASYDAIIVAGVTFTA